MTTTVKRRTRRQDLCKQQRSGPDRRLSNSPPASCLNLARTRQGGVRHGLDPSGADGPNLLFSPSRLLGPPPVTAVPLGVRLSPARPRRPNPLRHRWPPPASAVPLGVRPLLAGPATPNLQSPPHRPTPLPRRGLAPHRLSLKLTHLPHVLL